MISWQVLTFVSWGIAALAIILATIIDRRSQTAYQKLVTEKRQLQQSNAELHDTIADMLTSNEVRLASYEEKIHQLEQHVEMEGQSHSRSMQALEQKSLELQRRNQELEQKPLELQKRNQDLEQKSLELQKRNQDLEQAIEHLQQALATAASPALEQVISSEIKKSRSRAKPTARKITSGRNNGASPA